MKTLMYLVVNEKTNAVNIIEKKQNTFLTLPVVETSKISELMLNIPMGSDKTATIGIYDVTRKI